MGFFWLIGFIVIAALQVLIFFFWKDAKFWTLPNAIVLIVCIISYGHFRFEKLVHDETNTILNSIPTSEEKIVSEKDFKGLPTPVKNWLLHSGIVGKPQIRFGKVLQHAEMKLKPEQEDWYRATAVQYSTIEIPAFIWSVGVKMNRILSFQGRDKLENGKGEMLIKLNALFTIVDEKGPKLDEGSLQRFLGEMVWFPSLAMSPYIQWKEVNSTTAIATMDFQGTKGSGTFYFNPQGDFTKFSALRYKDNVANAKRYEWVLLVEEYKTFAGIKVPSKMTATWKLENMDWTWLKLEILDIQYNESSRKLN